MPSNCRNTEARPASRSRFGITRFTAQPQAVGVELDKGKALVAAHANDVREIVAHRWFAARKLDIAGGHAPLRLQHAVVQKGEVVPYPDRNRFRRRQSTRGSAGCSAG